MNLKPYPKYKNSGIEWLGEIPEGWEVRRLKYVCNEYAEYGLNIEAENYQSEGIRFIRTTDLDDYGNLKNEGVYINPVLAKDYILKDGDLLISRSGTIGRSFLYKSDKNEEATYAGYLVRYSPDSEKAFPKYLFYFTLSHSFYEWLKTQLIESTIGNVNGQKYANIFLPIPPKEEQVRISGYLDHKTSKIDELIKKNERLIELLKEKRQAIISQAVTKGLEPNAKLKDSGIEWIGEIPEGWEVKRLKYIAKIILGKMLQNENSGEDKLKPYLRAQNIQWEVVDVSDVKEMWFSDYEIKKYRLQIRDLLVSEGGEVGRTSLWDGELDECYVQNSVHKITVNDNLINNMYLLYLLETYGKRGFFEAIVSRVSIGHLTREKLKEIEIICPPKNEQDQIVTYLTQKTSQIDNLTKNIESQIETLKEYRQTLISNVVTGKVMVGEDR